MKRTVYIFIFIFVLEVFPFLPVKAQQAFYIYRNDGMGIQPFITVDVDSMAYSQIDIDSICHSEYVTQEIYTADSIFRIPLIAIDSIGFVTPETKFQPGVTEMTEEMFGYVLSKDSMTIKFNKETPSNFLPKVGDKLVTLEMTDIFPSGFAGEVIKCQQSEYAVEIVCQSVELTEIFECYYGLTTSIEKHESSRKRLKPHDDFHSYSKIISPGKQTLSLLNRNEFELAYKQTDDIAFNLTQMKTEISITPTIETTTYLIVNKEYGVNVCIVANGEYELEEKLGLCGQLSINHDFKIARPYYPLAPLVDAFLEVGAFIRAEANVGIEQSWEQKYRTSFRYEYNSKGQEVLKPLNRIIPISSSHDGVVNIDGSIGLGGYIELGLDFCFTKKAELAKVNLRGEFGMSIDGNHVLTKSAAETASNNTNVYEELQDSEISLNWFYGVKAEAEFLKFGISHDISLFGIPLNKKNEIISYSIVPHFYDVSISLGDNGQINTFMRANGNSLPCKIGFCVQGNDLGIREISDYFGFSPNNDTSYSYTFYGLPIFDYNVSPTVKYLDYDLLATPSTLLSSAIDAELCPDGNHPHAIDLGLPSGTKWACCNVGTNSVTESGGYYAWGEIEEKDYYGWNTYLYQMEGKWPNSEFIGDTISASQYDVAYMKWGGDWRMPTDEECNELIEHCSHQIIPFYGKGGTLFESPNGKKLFILHSGYAYEDRFEDIGYGGPGAAYYWTGNVTFDNDGSYAGYQLANILQIDYMRSGDYFWHRFIGVNSFPRIYGLPIRAVAR